MENGLVDVLRRRFAAGEQRAAGRSEQRSAGRDRRGSERNQKCSPAPHREEGYRAEPPPPVTAASSCNVAVRAAIRVAVRTAEEAAGRSSKRGTVRRDVVLVLLGGLSRAVLGGLSLAMLLGGCAGGGTAAVPAHCSGEVNEELANLIGRGYDGTIDNVLVCGTTIAASRPLPGGRFGSHALLPLRVPLPGGTSALVEVVTNDDLDGVVTAPRGAHVAAFGQYYHTTDSQRPFVAGIHETHCATHRGAANGWVVVNGTRYPQHAC